MRGEQERENKKEKEEEREREEPPLAVKSGYIYTSVYALMRSRHI
jgi:hypothetical protein